MFTLVFFVVRLRACEQPVNDFPVLLVSYHKWVVLLMHLLLLRLSDFPARLSVRLRLLSFKAMAELL
jgi:hypothetical protein